MYEIAILFILHWIGDFVFQSRWMASNKSKNIWALTLHVSIYSTVLFLGILLSSVLFFKNFNQYEIFNFIVINFILHWLTDKISSQFTKYFWDNKNIHNFFVTIGFDQLFHQICLIVTANLFLHV